MTKDQLEREVCWLRMLLRHDYKVRIIAYLGGWVLESRAGCYPRDDGWYNLRVTQDGLARAIYASREHVCRVLCIFEQEGMVVRGGVPRKRVGFLAVRQVLVDKAKAMLTAELDLLRSGVDNVDFDRGGSDG